MQVSTQPPEITWDDLGDIIRLLNLVPSETVVLRLPTTKFSSNQLSSTAWKEFLHCKAGQYDQESIDIYCYRGENIPNLIVYPEKLETKLMEGVPFFILTSRTVQSIGEHVMRGGDYEVVAVDKEKKQITPAKINTSMYQNYSNRYLKGKFFIFPKIVPDDFIDRVILQYDL